MEDIYWCLCHQHIPLHSFHGQGVCLLVLVHLLVLGNWDYQIFWPKLSHCCLWLTHSCCLIIIIATAFEQVLGVKMHFIQICVPSLTAFFHLSKMWMLSLHCGEDMCAVKQFYHIGTTWTGSLYRWIGLVVYHIGHMSPIFLLIVFCFFCLQFNMCHLVTPPPSTAPTAPLAHHVQCNQ